MLHNHFLELHEKLSKSSTFKEILIFLLFSFLVCLFFPELIFLKKIPNGGDVNVQFYPQFYFFSTSLKQKTFPLWNPYIFAGFPAFADPQSGFCYPIHLILFGLLNIEIAFGLDLAVHFLLAGWFTYLYLREIGINRAGAVLSGICYMFSSFLVPKILLPPLLFSSVYLPFSMLAVERICKSSNFGIGNCFIAVIAFSLLLLSGYPQYVVTIFLISLIYALCRIFQLSFVVEKKIKSRKFGKLCTIAILLILFLALVLHKIGKRQTELIIGSLWLLGFISIILAILTIRKIHWNYKLVGLLCLKLFFSILLAILLSAVYLLPGYELYRHSMRVGMASPGFVRGVLFFKHLPNIVRDLFEGKGIGDFEISGYIGATPLLLILLTLTNRLFDNRFRKYIIIFWLLLLFSIALVFLEPQTVSFVIQYVPIIRHFNVLHRYLLIFIFSLSVIAGFALHSILSYSNGISEILIPSLSIFISLSLLFSFLYGQHLIMNLLVGLTLFLSFFLAKELKLDYILSLLPVVVIVITLIELHPKFVNYPLEYISPAKLYPSDPCYLNLVKKEQNLYRCFSFLDERQIQIPTNTSLLAQLLIPNVASIYKIRDVQGYNPMILARYREYIDLLNQNTNADSLLEKKTHYALINSVDSHLLDLLNVKYVISASPLIHEKLEFVNMSETTVKVTGNQSELATKIYIYRNRNCLPQAFIVYQAELNKDLHSTLKQLSNKEVNPRTEVILNETFEKVAEMKFKLNARINSVTSQTQWRVNLINFSPNQIEYETYSAETGFLVLSELYYPGWCAYIDRKPTKILRANGIFRAIFLPAGMHKVKFRYLPSSLLWGLFISSATGLGLVLFIILKKP